MEIKLPHRLAVNGNGETKCVVFARDFFAAKRALAYLETQNIHAEEVNEYAPA